MKSKTTWIVAGGATGESGYCQRCGQGFGFGTSQPLYMAVAMMNAFVKEHSKCKDRGRVEPSPANARDRFKSRDTGTSSLTIYSVFMHVDSPHGRYDLPRDPQDFGRCYRLLQIMPSWKQRLHEVSAKYPEWKPLIERWDDLTALYEEELPRKTAPKLYALMQELRA